MEVNLYLLDELDSFEAYFKNVIFRNNNLVVPYINLGIWEHSLNPETKMKYLDYSYIIAEDIRFMDTWIKNDSDFNGQRYTIIGNEALEPIYYFGGNNLDRKSVFNDLKVCCKNAYIAPCNQSQLSDNPIYFDLNDKNSPMASFFEVPLPAIVEAFVKP